MVVLVVEKEGGGDGAGGVVLVHKADLELHLLVALDEFVGVVIGSPLGDVDGLGLVESQVPALEHQPLLLLLAAADLHDGWTAQAVGHPEHEVVLDVLVEVGRVVVPEGLLQHLRLGPLDLLPAHLLQLTALVLLHLLLDPLEQFHLTQTVHHALLRHDQIELLQVQLELSTLGSAYHLHLQGLQDGLVKLQGTVQVPHRQVYRVDFALVSQEEGSQPHREEGILITTLIDHFDLLDANVEGDFGLGSDPAFVVWVTEFLFDEGNGVELVGLEELAYLLEFVGEEEDLLAVELELEVGHADAHCLAAPLHDAVVLHQRNALAVEPEEGLAPAKTTVHQLHVLQAHPQAQASRYLHLHPHAPHPPTHHALPRPSLPVLRPILLLRYLLIPDRFYHFLHYQTALSLHHLVDHSLQVDLGVEGVDFNCELGGSEGDGDEGEFDHAEEKHALEVSTEGGDEFVPVLFQLHGEAFEAVPVLEDLPVDVAHNDVHFELQEELVDVVSPALLALYVGQPLLVLLHHCQGRLLPLAGEGHQEQLVLRGNRDHLGECAEELHLVVEPAHLHLNHLRLQPLVAPLETSVRYHLLPVDIQVQCSQSQGGLSVELVVLDVGLHGPQLELGVWGQFHLDEGKLDLESHQYIVAGIDVLYFLEGGDVFPVDLPVVLFPLEGSADFLDVVLELDEERLHSFVVVCLHDVDLLVHLLLEDDEEAVTTSEAINAGPGETNPLLGKTHHLWPEEDQLGLTDPRLEPALYLVEVELPFQHLVSGVVHDLHRLGLAEEVAVHHPEELLYRVLRVGHLYARQGELNLLVGSLVGLVDHFDGEVGLHCQQVDAVAAHLELIHEPHPEDVAAQLAHPLHPAQVEEEVVGPHLEVEDGQGYFQVDLLLPGAEELDHDPRDVDAVVELLGHVVEEGGLELDERHPVHDAAHHLLSDPHFLLEDLHLQEGELLLAEDGGEGDHGEVGVEVVRSHLLPPRVQDYVLHLAPYAYLPSEVHVDLQEDADEGEVSDGGVLEVADAQVDAVDLGLDEYFLEDVDALHGLELLLLVQEFLHHLPALLCVFDLSDLLHLLVEAHLADDLISDVLQDGERYFPEYLQELCLLRGHQFFVPGDFGDGCPVELLGVVIEVVALPAVLDDVEPVVVEVLHAVEHLAQLLAPHPHIDAVDHHRHLHDVTHVRRKSLRTHRAQPDCGQVLEGVLGVGLVVVGGLLLVGGGGGGVPFGEGVAHGPDEGVGGAVEVVADEELFLVVEVELELVDVEYLLEGLVLLLVGEVAGVEGAFLVLVDGVAGDVVHDEPEGVVPVAAVALQPHVDVVYAHHCVVHDPDQVLLREALLLPPLLAPLLLHLQPYALHHAPQQLPRLHLRLPLLVADVQQHVDPPHAHHRALLLEAGPGDADVDLLDVAELEGEGQAQLVDEAGLQGHVLDAHLPVQQSDVQAVLQSVDVLPQVFHQHALNDVLHLLIYWIYYRQMESEAATLRSENAHLRAKLTQLQVELQEHEAASKEVQRQLAELAHSHAALACKVEQHRVESREGLERLQATLDERSNQICILKSQMEVVEDSNQSLSELLRKANQKVVELTRQLAERNRFIREYIEQEEKNDH